MSDLSINVSCDVEMKRGSRLSWSSNTPEAFSVSESGSRLSIKQKSGYGGGTTIISGGGRTIISGGNSISINGGTIIGGHVGEVWVNGKRVDVPAGDSSGPMPELPCLTVTIPDGTNAEIAVQSSCDIYGDAIFGRVNLSTSGSASVDLIAHSADISTSGSSNIEIRTTGGKVTSRCSGSTKLAVTPA